MEATHDPWNIFKDQKAWKVLDKGVRHQIKAKLENHLHQPAPRFFRLTKWERLCDGLRLHKARVGAWRIWATLQDTERRCTLILITDHKEADTFYAQLRKAGKKESRKRKRQEKPKLKERHKRTRTTEESGTEKECTKVKTKKRNVIMRR